MNNSGELLARFRSDVVDEARPYLWTDAEIYGYMDAAYRQFVRRTSGIADFTSAVTRIPIVAGEPIAAIDKSILRVMSAVRASDGGVVDVINMTDVPTLAGTSDYDRVNLILNDTLPGKVNYMVVGAERNKVKWIHVPVVNDEVRLHVYRLPLVHITDDTHLLDDVDEDHHIYLLYGMKELAYLKQDAETFDRTKSKENQEQFAMYCAQSKAEWERYKHKTRVVAYNGP